MKQEETDLKTPLIICTNCVLHKISFVVFFLLCVYFAVKLLAEVDSNIFLLIGCFLWNAGLISRRVFNVVWAAER